MTAEYVKSIFCSSPLTTNPNGDIYYHTLACLPNTIFSKPQSISTKLYRFYIVVTLGHILMVYTMATSR